MEANVQFMLIEIDPFKLIPESNAQQTDLPDFSMKNRMSGTEDSTPGNPLTPEDNVPRQQCWAEIQFYILVVLQP